MKSDYVLANNRFFYELFSKVSPDQEERHDSQNFYLNKLLDQSLFLKEEICNPRVKHVSEMIELSGAVLVAEAGMGKTFVMKFLSSRIEEGKRAEFRASDYLNDIYAFGKDIKEINREIEYIFIDGLDENQDAISTILRTIKPHCPNKKVFLATRGIKEVQRISTELSLPVYSLLPLSKKMVRDYAEHEGIDVDDFIDTIARKNMPPVCRNPLGCNLLIRLYRQNILSHISNDDLWQQSILMLCSENDSDPKIQAECKEYITPEECLNQASKIALVLKLSNQNEIDGGHNSYQQPQKNEENLYHLFWRDIPNFKTVLSRALFVPVGNNYYRFAHESFQEYLVAVGLAKFTRKENWDALFLSEDRQDIYPQWESVASYLASLDEEWRDKIIKIRPDLVLVFDNIVSELNHAELLRCFLSKIEDYDFWTLRNGHLLNQLCKLNHSEIIPILRNVLENDVPIIQKEVVIDIIREERILNLEKQIADVFCNPNESVLLRNYAGYALQEIASKESRIQCKDVLNEENVPLCLKGHVFSMTWPDLISVKEIRPHLINTEDIDAYTTWMELDFPRTLINLASPTALELLEWAVSDIKTQGGVFDRLLRMRQMVFTVCWKKFNDQTSLPLLADGYYRFSKIHKSPFPNVFDFLEPLPQELVYKQEDFSKDKEKRYNLARELMKKNDQSEAPFIFYTPEVLSVDDINFLFDMIACPDEKSHQKVWGRWLWYLRNGIPIPEMSDQWNEIHTLCPDVFPNSAEKEIIVRAEHAQRIRFQEQKAAERAKKTKENKQKQLALCKNALYKIDAAKYIPSIVDYCVRDSQKDIFTYDTGNAWNSFSDEDKNRVVSLARDYLIKSIPFKRNNDNFYAYITTIFLIMYKEDRKVLEALPSEVWMEYSKDLFDGIEYNRTPALTSVVIYMKDYFPEIFYESLFHYAKERILSSHYFYLSQYAFTLEDSFLGQLAELCMTATCDNQKRFIVLKDIYVRNKTVLKTIFETFFPFLTECKTPDSDFEYQKTLIYLISKTGIFSIVIVFDLFPNNFCHFLRYINTFPEKGKTWIESLMEIERHEHWVSTTIKKLPAEELASFFIWLEIYYPSNKQPQHGPSFTPTLIDLLYFFKERLINIIAESESLSSVESLKKIQMTAPNIIIDNYIRTAKTNELRIKCPSYQCEVIKQIMDKSICFLINSPQDLLNFIYKTLLEYQTFLNGKMHPRIGDLWNISDNTYTHKPEKDFSDHLCSYLDICLKPFNIFINREVELNQGTHGESGAQTDIWIETSSHNKPPRKFKLCIEVKGNWNASVTDALNAQLIGKYMGKGAADVGILLVGWFQSKKCHISSPLGDSFEEAQEFLQRQETDAIKNGHCVRCIVIDCEYRK